MSVQSCNAERVAAPCAVAHADTCGALWAWRHHRSWHLRSRRCRRGAQRNARAAGLRWRSARHGLQCGLVCRIGNAHAGKRQRGGLRTSGLQTRMAQPRRRASRGRDRNDFGRDDQRWQRRLCRGVSACLRSVDHFRSGACDGYRGMPRHSSIDHFRRDHDAHRGKRARALSSLPALVKAPTLSPAFRRFGPLPAIRRPGSE